MTELTGIQQRIRTSLITAISSNNPQAVQDIFEDEDNEYDDIQAALRHKGTFVGNEDTILDLAIVRLNIAVEAQAQVKIIKLIWEGANQETRDSVCCRAIDSFLGLQKDLNNIPALETVIEEIEEHKRVMDLDIALRRAIRSLDVDQVKATLENCGEDVERVLEREVYWNGGSVDALLVYPLLVDYERNLGKEESKKIKEITKLLWDKASPDVRNSWLEDHMVNGEGQNTGDNYIIDSLERQQEMYDNIAGERWLEDFIQEVQDYKTNREIELNEPILEEVDKQALELVKEESLLTAPTAGNITPEKNDTTFWSEHKGKIALGGTGLCVAGAVAVYVLAYPVVALALTVLAAVILMGAGIAKVLEDPSVEKPFTQQQEV
ncbi:hypothetical protein [Wolbachia endosymbiont (group A) of Agelastica alni]|uniref:hypothetical protein n=1 Tax=Wolbachia endosymbiont (group A) of Agelastica alni TaxID=3066130 RepID=UPI0033426DCE